MSNSFYGGRDGRAMVIKKQYESTYIKEYTLINNIAHFQRTSNHNF